jgi:hypothetical protein
MVERPRPCDDIAAQAFRAGTKTLLRLALEPQPKATQYPGHTGEYWSWLSPTPTPGYKGRFGLGVWPDLAKFLKELVPGCPWGQPGDRLWVQQEWAQLEGGTHVYRADGGWIEGAIDWKPASTMSREVSRILVEIVALRVERLLSMSEADALADGVQPVKVPTSYPGPGGIGRHYHDVTKFTNYAGRQYCDGMNLNTAKESYESLCISRYGAMYVLSNPFFWVLEVKVVALDWKEVANA